MLYILDVFFSILHIAIIGFNLLGWIWPRTRKAHLITIAATGASWFLLGIWFGIGYCPITDWQWDVKEKLGERNLPNSFVKYMGDKITGRDLDASMIDTLTLSCFIAAIVLSVYFNFFRRKRKAPAYK
jgi:hypothetical protein